MEGAIKSYRDLIVWQKAHELAKKVIRLVASFPRSEEAIIIKRQLVKAATSVPANIAEGYGGNRGKAFQNSLTIARRECGETDYWLFLCHDIGIIDRGVHGQTERGYAEVRAILTSLIEKLDEVS